MLKRILDLFNQPETDNQAPISPDLAAAAVQSVTVNPS